jgi:hypothetical protein
LSEESRSASPSVYGELVIGTNGNIEFQFDGDKIMLEAPIIVRNAELTFAPQKSGYKNTSENFVYKYTADTVSIEEKEMDFESLVELAQQRSNLQASGPSVKSAFDYRINLTVEEEATIIFVLSEEFDQDLTAVLEGNIEYENIGGNANTQGELKLLEGSTLEFLKTLEADGTIRFESELSNPYLNITASYFDYFYPTPDEEVEVAVKIKIEGPLKELDKRLIQEEDNIAVYYGSEAIDNNEPSPEYDASDAVMFILLGRFTDQADQQEINEVNSYAASIGGSLLGGFLNKQLGDYVSRVEVRQSTSGTRVSLAGRAGKFRYTLGTRTDLFQDVSQANVKIEYPINQRLLLRIERKEAITETSFSNEMINELGLQYRFEF